MKTVGFGAEKVRFPDLLLEKRTGFSRYLIEIAFSDIFIRKPPEADLLIRVFRALKRVTRVNRPATGFFRIYKSGRAMFYNFSEAQAQKSASEGHFKL